MLLTENQLFCGKGEIGVTFWQFFVVFRKKFSKYFFKIIVNPNKYKALHKVKIFYFFCCYVNIFIYICKENNNKQHLKIGD